MPYHLHGNLTGLICPDCPVPVANSLVRLYRLERNIDPTHATSGTAADPKLNFKELTDKDVAAKKDRLVGEGRTDARGNFKIEFAENYDGGPIEVDLFFDHAPDEGTLDPDKKFQPRQFTIDVIQPRWNQRPDGIFAYYEQAILQRIWCRILELFGLWVICGVVLDQNCKNPVGSVRVTACDRDFIQDDKLGEALTDGEGRFRIYYRADDFRRTLLSPLLNAEHGNAPDVYFIVDLPGTELVLLKEPRSKGLEPGRRDVPRCFCVRLCVKEPSTPPRGIDPLFTHVGNYDIATDFTASGLTNVGSLAFHNVIPLDGMKPSGGSGTNWEYRFRYENLTTGDSGIVDSSIISATKIGSLFIKETTGGSVTYSWADYWLNNPPAAHNVMPSSSASPADRGWIVVPNENTISSSGGTTTQTTFFANQHLARIDTRKLFEALYDIAAHQAGNALPASAKPVPPSQTFRITFEARVAGSSSVSHSNALARIVISNLTFVQTRHPYWSGGVANLPAVCMLDINELKVGSGCDKINNTLTLSYSAYHPHVDTVSLWVEGNLPPGTWSTNPVPDATGEARALNATPFNASLLNPCAYILWLSISLRLTNGINRPDPVYDHIAFCIS